MLHWKKIKNSVKDTARKAKMAKWQDIEEMRHWVLGEPSSEFEKQMYDMAVVIVEEIIDRAQTKIRKSKRRRATQYSFKRVPSADLYSHDSRENLIEEQKSFAGASELAIPSFTSFSHYDGATAIFKDSTGSKSALNSPSLRKLPVIPGTPREMKMIRFEIRRYLPKTKEPPRLTDKISTIAQYGSACGPLSGVLRKSYEDPRVDVPVKLPVFVRPASKSTDGILDENVLNVFSDESREKQEEGKRFGVGVFVLDAQTHRKSLREFMLYNQLLGKRCQRNRNLGAHLSSLMEARTLLEDQQPGNVPKKVRRQRPTFTFSDKESKGHPEGYQGYKHGQVTLLQSRPKKTTTDPKKPQKKSSETKRGIGIKTIIADKLFNPGDKHGRPVRGYRVWPLKPEKKRTPLSALTNPRALSVAAVATAENNGAPQTANGSNGSPLAFHEPLQLMYEDEQEPNQIYMLTKEKTGTMATHPREKVSIRTVSLPRRGRIKLTALPYELDNPEYFDDRKADPVTPWHQKLRRPKFSINLPVLCLQVC